MEFKKVHAYLNNFFWLFSTYLLAPYFYFRIFWRTLRHSSGQEKNASLKILVIQTGKIGDLVCTTHVFREIKEKFPSAHLTALVLSKAKGILENNPRIDEIMSITDHVSIRGKLGLLSKLRKEKYDWVFNLLPDSFGGIISFWSLVPNRVTTTYKHSGEITKLLSIFNNYRLEYQSHSRLTAHYLNLLKFIGIKHSSERKEVFWKEKDEGKVGDFLNKHDLKEDDLLIGISVTTGVRYKNWGDAKFAALSDKLIKELGAKIIFVGGPNDRPAVKKVQDMMQGDSVNSAGLFALSSAPALLKKLRLFISVDTGPLYIANAVMTPVIDIGGSLDFREQGPMGEKCKIMPQKNSSSYSFMDFIDSVREKWLNQQLEEISPTAVFETARSLLAIDTKY